MLFNVVIENKIMAKKLRIKIKLLSTAGTGHFYTTTKNSRNTNNLLSLIKYDPYLKKHVLYKEIKIN